MFREDDLTSLTCDEDRKHFVYFNEISANILRNVPKENKKYVQKQLSKLDENFMDYIFIEMRNIIGMGLWMVCS